MFNLSGMRRLWTCPWNSNLLHGHAYGPPLHPSFVPRPPHPNDPRNPRRCNSSLLTRFSLVLVVPLVGFSYPIPRHASHSCVARRREYATLLIQNYSAQLVLAKKGSRYRPRGKSLLAVLSHSICIKTLILKDLLKAIQHIIGQRYLAHRPF